MIFDLSFSLFSIIILRVTLGYRQSSYIQSRKHHAWRFHNTSSLAPEQTCNRKLHDNLPQFKSPSDGRIEPFPNEEPTPPAPLIIGRFDDGRRQLTGDPFSVRDTPESKGHTLPSLPHAHTHRQFVPLDANSRLSEREGRLDAHAPHI